MQRPLPSFLTRSVGAFAVSDAKCILGCMKTPDVTPVQIVAIVTATLQTLVAFGVDLSTDQQNALLALCGVVAITVLGDAHVRGKRADNADKVL